MNTRDGHAAAMNNYVEAKTKFDANFPNPQPAPTSLAARRDPAAISAGMADLSGSGQIRRSIAM